MRLPKVGMRVVKTIIAVFLSIAIYIILLLINKALGLTTESPYAPTEFYTPFYAGIAAVYTLHRGRKSSFTLAKSRSFGSFVGGYYGLVIVLLCDSILINILDLQNQNAILYQLILYFIVSLSMLPLIQFTIFTKHSSSVFITCLTFLSVTISSRNGGQHVLLFANNRILSTLIGIGISLLVNNFSIFVNKNKDILFVSSLDNNILTSKSENISQYIKYKLNNLYYKNMALTFATTRTLSSLEYIFNNVDIEFPVVVMNGAAIYHFKEKQYTNVHTINNEARLFIDQKLKNLGINAFTYSIDDNILHSYYTKLNNEGEKHFYTVRRKNDFDNFVRAKLPSDADVTLYIIINEKSQIDQLAEELSQSEYSKYFDLVTYPFDEIEGDYYYLKINSNDSRKEKLTNKIKEEGQYNKLVVCGSGKTDLALIENADFSFCLKTAPEYIKEAVDVVIGDNPEDILKVFERIYHAYNVDKAIDKIKQKYKKRL